MWTRISWRNKKKATRGHHLELVLSSVISKYGSPEQSSWHSPATLIVVSDKTAVKCIQILSCFMELCLFPLLGSVDLGAPSRSAALAAGIKGWASRWGMDCSSLRLQCAASQEEEKIPCGADVPAMWTLRGGGGSPVFSGATPQDVPLWSSCCLNDVLKQQHESLCWLAEKRQGGLVQGRSPGSPELCRSFAACVLVWIFFRYVASSRLCRWLRCPVWWQGLGLLPDAFAP